MARRIAPNEDSQKVLSLLSTDDFFVFVRRLRVTFLCAVKEKQPKERPSYDLVAEKYESESVCF